MAPIAGATNSCWWHLLSPQRRAAQPTGTAPHQKWVRARLLYITQSHFFTISEDCLVICIKGEPSVTEGGTYSLLKDRQLSPQALRRLKMGWGQLLYISQFRFNEVLCLVFCNKVQPSVAEVGTDSFLTDWRVESGGQQAPTI